MRIVVLTGAGISRESGLATFRDADGLWAGYRIEDVCTPRALAKDPKAVLDFYNMRRREVRKAEPNVAHYALAEMEKHFDVQIITQNVDDLHERAGSTHVLHLHGEVLKARSMQDERLIVPWTDDLNLGDLGSDGAQLRPHICFFEEMPFFWDEASALAESADIFCVIGTSLNVYPAAHLVHMTRASERWLIDPNPPEGVRQVHIIEAIATVGVPRWCDIVRKSATISASD